MMFCRQSQHQYASINFDAALIFSCGITVMCACDPALVYVQVQCRSVLQTNQAVITLRYAVVTAIGQNFDRHFGV